MSSVSSDCHFMMTALMCLAVAMLHSPDLECHEAVHDLWLHKSGDNKHSSKGGKA